MTNLRTYNNEQSRENSTNSNNSSLTRNNITLITKQISKTMMMLALVIGLTAVAVTAQKITGGGFAPVGHYTGIETAPGTPVVANSMNYGNTFVLQSFGEWETHHLTVTLNYSNNSIIANDFIVTGGSWSLVITRENQYVGTLYGVVETGSLSVIVDGNGEAVSKSVYANLSATGGMGIYNGRASQNISGIYNMNTDLRSNITSGNASYTF